MEEKAQRHGREGEVKTGRNWNDLAACKECWRPPQVGRGRKGISVRTSRKSMALPTPRFWTSGLQNCERIKFHCLQS